MTPSEFRDMWERDLTRIGLQQQGVAAELRKRGAPLTPSAVSQWVAQGYPPRGRVKMLTDIFGPESEFAKVPPETWAAMWAAGAKAAKEARASLTAAHQAATAPQTSPEPSTDSGRTQRYVPLSVRIKEASPVELQKSFRPELPDRPRRHIPAYQHDGLTVEFVMLRGGPMLRLSAAAAMFRMAVMKKTYHAKNQKHQYMLMLVEDDLVYATTAQIPELSESEKSKVIAELREDAEVLGLTLSLADGPKQAANYLESRAFDMVNGDPEGVDVAELAADDEFFNQN